MNPAGEALPLARFFGMSLRRELGEAKAADILQEAGMRYADLR